MKIKKLENISIICEPPRVPYYIKNKGLDAIADYYKSWVRDFDEFIRDHRSQDPVSLDVERHYIYVCSHCNSEYTEENGIPTCCDEAINEYNSTTT